MCNKAVSLEVVLRGSRFELDQGEFVLEIFGELDCTIGDIFGIIDEK
jgi:hypothetical protein